MNAVMRLTGKTSSNVARKENIIWAISVILSFTTVCAVFSTYDSNEDFNEGGFHALQTIASSMNARGSFVLTACFALFVIAFRWLLRQPWRASRRVTVSALASSLVLALTLTMSPYRSEDGTVLFSIAPVPAASVDGNHGMWFWAYICGKYVALSAALFIVARWLLTVLQTYDSVDRNMHQILTRWQLTLRNIFVQLNVRHWAVVTAFMLVLWIPWMIMVAPVNIAADTVAQLVWARGDHVAWDPSSRLDLPGYTMSDQHPWADTLIYGTFDKFGLMIGHEAVGLYLLALLQVVCTAGALSLLVCYMGAWHGVPWQVCSVGTVVYALVPCFGRLPMSVVKDSTFMPFFIAWLVLFVELLRRIRYGERIHPMLVAGLVTISVCCVLTKKTALYVIAISMIVALVVFRKRFVTLISLLLMLGLFSGINSVAYAELRIAPAGTQESIAITLQQTAYNLLQHGSEISDSDRAVIDAVYVCSEDQTRELFTKDGSDPIKDHCFNRDATTRDVLQYLLVWAKQGLMHPNTYVSAVPWLRNPLSMNTVYDEGFYVRWGWEDKGGSEILPQAPEKSKQQKVGEKVYYALASMPVVGLLMTENWYVVWMPVLAVAACVVLQRRRNLWYATPLFLSMLTLLLSPAYQTRYSWSLLFGFFLLLALPFAVGGGSRPADES